MQRRRFLENLAATAAGIESLSNGARAGPLVRIIHEMRQLPVSRERLRRPAVRKGFAFPRARLIFSSEHSARLSLVECSEVKKRALAESRRLSAQQSGKSRWRTRTLHK